MITALKRRIPFLRWSFWRLVLGMKQLERDWQVGDGREDELREHVLARARKGDPADAIRVIDDFAYERSFLINVGDEKGRILDEAVRRSDASRVLELGTYCGYSALRMAVAAPQARIFSLELNDANATIARSIFDHAGVADRIQIVVGTLGDGGETMRALEQDHGFEPGCLDVVFIDHAKDAYLPDLRRILDAGWLRAGSTVVADNVKFPGVPDYRAYMAEQEGARFRTSEHETHVEYQSLIKDLVMVSEYVGGAAPG